MNIEERRSFTRVSVDIPLFCDIELENKQIFKALVADISKGGVQLILSPGAGENQEWLGMGARIISVKGELASFLIGNKGFICWLSPQRCGIRFYDTLDAPDTVLLAAASSL